MCLCVSLSRRFLAFNAGSELGVADPYRADYAARAATNTILAPSAAGLTAVVATKIGYAKEEVNIVRGVKVNTVHPFGGHWSLLVLCNGIVIRFDSIRFDSIRFDSASLSRSLSISNHGD